MSDRINGLIERIGEKATSFHNQYLTERSNSQKLQDEINALKNELSSKEESLKELSSKLVELERQNKSAGKNDIHSSLEKGISNEQIDELVMEIEYCIEQLKK